MSTAMPDNEVSFNLGKTDIPDDIGLLLDAQLIRINQQRLTDEDRKVSFTKLAERFDLPYLTIAQRMIGILLKMGKQAAATPLVSTSVSPATLPVNLAGVSATEPYAINPDGIHEKIKLIPRFVVWDLNDLRTTGKNKGKLTKRPLQTNGVDAETDNSSTYCSYEKATQFISTSLSLGKKYGLGWVLNNYSIEKSERLTWERGQVGVDLDDCILLNGELTEWAQPIVRSFTEAGALIEYSPSGKGLHIFCSGKPFMRGRQAIPPEKRELGLDSKEGVEVYDHIGARYFTMTGHILHNGDPEVDGQKVLDWIFYQFWDEQVIRPKKTAYESNYNSSGDVDVELVIDALTFIKIVIHERFKWFKILCGLKHGGIKFEIADEWSSEQAEYEGTGDVKATWNSIKPRGPEDATLGTVFHYAKEGGWTEPRKKTRTNKNTKLQKEIMTNSESNPESNPESTTGDGLNPEDMTDNSQLGIARNTIKSFGKDNLIYAQSNFYRWTNQLWAKANDLEIKKQITRICELTNSNQLKLPEKKQQFREATASRVDSILKHMKMEAFDPKVIFDPQSEVINCLNGELHMDGRGWKLHPHKRESYRSSLIPVSYDPEAKAPRFQQFLDEIFAKDNDLKEKQECIFQFLGYSLTTNCKYEKYILLIGAGENGKSVLLSVVDNLVGSHNVSAVDPANFTNQFQLAHLRGKYVNIVPELREGLEIDDAAFKSVTTGEKKQASEKFKDPFDFYPYAKLWLATNHLPHSRDVSHAFFRRPLIIEFNQTFRKANNPDRKTDDPIGDPTLRAKLITELPGILNLVLNGLASLRTNGDFTEPTSSYKARASWRFTVDQIAQFVDDCCRIGEGMTIAVKALYEAYQGWAPSAGISKTFNKIRFGKRLEDMGYKSYLGSGNITMRSGIEIDYSKVNYS